ncbi:MAG TPA: bacillithiol transferase BstA [Blastocatellia bacterium]|nr:bacillithiol transferase BstA [Blastocatellia bacterium]
MTDLRYPIGAYEPLTNSSAAQRHALIENIAALPQQLRAAVQGLSAAQLDTPYRPDGWTVRQVVHHVADSHLNSYIRFRWALTEEEPLIKAYDEKAWATLPDAGSAAPDVSLALLETLHARWVLLLSALTPEQFNRRLRHPEAGLLKLETMLGLYDWHGRHHVAHITSLRQRQGW